MQALSSPVARTTRREQFNGELRRRRGAGAQGAHVGGNAGNAQQAALAVQQGLNAVVQPQPCAAGTAVRRGQWIRSVCPSPARRVPRTPWSLPGCALVGWRTGWRPLPRRAMRVRPWARALHDCSVPMMDWYDNCGSRTCARPGPPVLGAVRSGIPRAAAWRERPCQSRPPGAVPERPR